MSIELMAQYLDDRESLSDAEMQTLLAFLKDNPDKAQELHELMQVDNSLFNQLSEHPSSLTQQVNQRLDDLSHPSKKIKTKKLVKKRLQRQRLRAKAKHRGLLLSLATIAAFIAIAALIGPESLEPAQPTKQSLNAYHIVSKKAVVERDGKGILLSGSRTIPAQANDTIKGEASVTLASGKSTHITTSSGTTFTITAHDKTTLGLQLTRGTLNARINRQEPGLAMLHFSTPSSLIIIQGTEFSVNHTYHTSYVSLKEGKLSFASQDKSKTLALSPGESALHHPRLGLLKSQSLKTLMANPPVFWLDATSSKPGAQTWPSKHGNLSAAAPTPAQAPSLAGSGNNTYLHFDGKDDELSIHAPTWKGQHTILMVVRRHGSGPGQRSIVDGYHRGSIVGQFENETIRQGAGKLVPTLATQWNINYVYSKQFEAMGGLTIGSLGNDANNDWGREPGNVDVKAILVFKGKLTPETLGAWLVYLKSQYPNSILP